jgi:DNA-binding beta-propeller fold protein YncE
LALAVAVAALVSLAAVQAPAADVPLKKPQLLLILPDYCNTPDGMTLMPDGNIILSVPNYNDKSAPPVLVKITPQNKAELFYKLPPHPETGRIGPMGIAVAPDGDLYLCDNQLFHHPDGKSLLYGKSRLLRIPMRDGKPQEPVVVASGLNVANGVAIDRGGVFVTETILEAESKPLLSGVYRFKLGEEGVVLKTPLKSDPHVITTLLTHHKRIPFGADGIAFNAQGTLFVGNFADGTMHKIVMDPQGKVVSNTIFARGPNLKSCDGTFCDKRTGKLYVADFMANAIRIISPDGSIQTLAQSPDGDGADGGLESPCEPLLRGREIIVSNMDFPVEGSVNTKAEKPFTMSVIKLD